MTTTSAKDVSSSTRRWRPTKRSSSVTLRSSATEKDQVGPEFSVTWDQYGKTIFAVIELP